MYLLINKDLLEGKYAFDLSTPMEDGNIVLPVNVLKAAPELEDLGRIISPQKYNEMVMKEKYSRTLPKEPVQEEVVKTEKNKE